MNSKKIQDNIIEDSVYEVPTFYKLKYIVIGISMLVIGFVFNFPVKSIIKTQVENALLQNRSCPIEYSELDISLFLPNVNFITPKINGKCFNKPNESLLLDNLQVRTTIPVLFPPGIKLHAEINKGDTKLNLYPRVSLGRTDLNISNSNITGKFISTLIGQENLIAGNLDIKGVINLENHQLSKGALRISSKDFNINSQTINNFTIPALNIGNINFSGDLVKKKLDIKLRAGNEAAPVFAEFKGSIFLNMRNMSASGLKLTGEFSLSDDFLKKNSFIALLLSSKKKVDGKYIINVNGSLSRPSISIL
tara:strand:- start:171423 stop:172343 length:921 start_codon:yes stop_codon:yes gene_type:complete